MKTVTDKYKDALQEMLRRSYSETELRRIAREALAHCEYCDHGKSVAIQAGQPVACAIHEKTFPADHTCERWRIIRHNSQAQPPDRVG